MEEIIIDVREKDEFRSEHIAGSINLPLTCFFQEASALLGKFENKKITIMCLSGNRAKMALKYIKKLPKLNHDHYEIYPGGIKAWQREGKKVITPVKVPISIMRQVQITAGLLIILSGILAMTVKPDLWVLSIMIGAGLTFSGITGTCALAGVLKRMPWNNS